MKSFPIYKTRFAVFVIITVFCTILRAEHSVSAELDKLFADAINAVGSKQKIDKIRSIEAAANCTGPHGTYTTEIVSYRDGKTIFKQKFSNPDIEPVNFFVNGKTGWGKSEKTGEFSILSPTEISIARGHEFQLIVLDFQKRFHDFSMEGIEIFEKKTSVKVRAKNESGDTIYLFFDIDTKLFSGTLMPIPNSNESIKTFFNEWKTIGKLKLPSVVTATDSRGNYVLRFHTITLNKTDPKIFDIPERIKDLTELLRMQENQRTAHLTYNAELLVGESEEQPMVVQRGAVSTRTREANLARVKAYFSQFKFLEWENIKPPVIRISKDGTMATIIVQKRVRGTYKDEQGQEKLEHMEFAWLEVWEKVDGNWKLMTIASTEKVIEDKVIENNK